MDSRIDEKRIIAEARGILLLLERGRDQEATEKIAGFDAELSKQNRPAVATDVWALWDQVGIAANNMSNRRYFEDVKDELNRMTFKYVK